MAANQPKSSIEVALEWGPLLSHDMSGGLGVEWKASEQIIRNEGT